MLRKAVLRLLVSTLIAWVVILVLSPPGPPGQVACKGECQLQFEECLHTFSGKKPFSRSPLSKP